MLKRGLLTLFFLVAICLGVPALAQWETTHPALDTHHLSRDFAGSRITTDLSLRAGGSLEPGQRAVIQLDIDTTLNTAGAAMPRAVMINGFVTVGFPPGMEPDGQPRLKYYDTTKQRYEYLYSKSYPRLDRFDGLGPAIDNTTSGDPSRMLRGLHEICTSLDPAVRVTGPADPRLTGTDRDYAVTGVSWLIPCNVMFKELVGLFDPDSGIGRSAKLRVSLPVQATDRLSDPHLVVYIGGLSAGVTQVSLLPDEIPPTAIPLGPLPEPEPAPATEEPVAAEGNPGDAPADNGSKSEARIKATETGGNEDTRDSEDRKAGEDNQPPPPPEPIPVLVYSYEWQSWETELSLAKLLTAAVETPVTPSHLDTQLEPEIPSELVEEIQPVPDPTLRPERFNSGDSGTTTPALPATATAEPEVTTPEMVEPPLPDPEPPVVEETIPAETDPAPATDGETGARQVEPGTLPPTVDSYTVALKPITGSGAGSQSRPPRDTAPAVTQNTYQAPAATYSPPAQSTAPPTGLGEMILIPEGYFLMGTAAGSSAGDADEEPQTQVYLPAYYIDRYPVTNRQFYEFVISAGYKPDGNWDKYYSQGTADLPVRGVTWDDAQAFARWAGKRLPTEAEWEKAARGDDGRTYPWGEEWSSEIIPRGEYLYDIMRAESAASPYGVMGLVGLVWQWTASAYQPYPFNPDARGDKKVLRGGAYSNGRNIIRCANRYAESGNVALNTFGFRCAKDA